MVKNEECEIVRDLFPSYAEKILSKNSEKFIENHINNCYECKEIFKTLQNEREKKENEISLNDQLEAKCLKKINKKLLLLKIIFILIILILVIVLGLFFSKINHINNIIKTSYNKTQELKNLENYTISIQQHDINYIDINESIFYTKYYYINNNYKIENSWDISYEDTENPSSSYYGKINSNQRTEIYDDTKKIINSTSNYNYETKTSFINFTYLDISNYAKSNGFLNIFLISGIKVRNDRFNGKECYVLRFQSDPSEGYKEIWIEKETMLPVRIVEDLFNKLYTEKTMILNIDTVNSIDVEIPDKEGYSIENINTNIDDKSFK